MFSGTVVDCNYSNISTFVFVVCVCVCLFAFTPVEQENTTTE